jgi:hypothetical protein
VGPALLIARLKAIREPRIRVLLLASALGDGEAADWVETLAAVLARGRAGQDADAALALEAVVQCAGEASLPYAIRQRLYEAAVSAGHAPIARLFLAASPQVVGDRQLARALAPERALRPNDRPLSLGERKALARTNRRDQISLLLRDPHPDVVTILLGNPHVTESDVVRVAAARPAVPSALALIAAHPRWSVRHAIKRALVLNPATPLADAIRIATTLPRADLAELSRDAAVPEVLRAHAADLVDAAQGRRVN